MTITLWVTVDISGEVTATARIPAQYRIDALNELGCRIYEVEVVLPIDVPVAGRVRTADVHKLL